MRFLDLRSATLLLAGFFLAACGTTTTNGAGAPQLSAQPSLVISVPLTLATCNGANLCYAFGTTGFGQSPDVAGQVSTDGRNWHGVAVPDAADSLLTTSSCWRNGCLAGGTGSTGVLLWHVVGGNVTTLTGPAGAVAVQAISCFTALSCALVATSGTFVPQLSTTLDGGTTWSAPVPLPSTVANVFSLACNSATTCVAAGSSTSRHGVAVATSDGGAHWSTPTTLATTRQLADLFCVATRCVALATNTDGSHVVERSNDAGAAWSPTPQQPSRDINLLACTSLRTCIGADATSGVAVEHGGRWSYRAARFFPGPAQSIACGTTRCLSVSSTAELLLTP